MISRSRRPAAAATSSMIKSLGYTLLRTGHDQRKGGSKNNQTISKRCLHNGRLKVIYFLAVRGISFTFLARWGTVKVNKASGRLGLICQSLSVASYWGCSSLLV